MTRRAEDTPHLVAARGPGDAVHWQKWDGLDMTYATNKRAVLLSRPISDEEWRTLSIDELREKYPAKVVTE